LALIETILFMWVFGPDNAWHELHEGASIRIPRIFKFIMTYVTPVFLLVMMAWWIKQDALPTLLYQGVPADQHATRTASRLVMVGILVLQLFLIRAAWRRKATRPATTGAGR
jgi:hypothetical protein